MSNTYGFSLPPNPLNSSLNPGTSTLNPMAAQAAQNQVLTAQQQKQSQEMASLLQKEGQNAQNKQFTSPWQVAGQWAQALAGKNKQAGVNQGSSILNSMFAPGQQPSPAGGPPSPAATIPGQSPATAPAAPGAGTSPQLPWSGAPPASALAPTPAASLDTGTDMSSMVG